MSSELGAALREPAHQVSPRATAYWRTGALVQLGVLVVALGAAWMLVPERPWWLYPLTLVLLVSALVPVLVMPPVRYRIHRWEVTEEAVFTRSGWLGREQRIAPLSRVQTVDSRQSALMRLYGLMSVTVTTASAAGPIQIECLDEEVARDLVTELTERTSADEGDAT